MAILIGTSGLHAHRRSRRRERRSAIRANRRRAAELEERRVEDALNVFAIGLGERFAAEQETREAIDERERIALDVILRDEPSLEVDAPDLVGRFASLERRGHADRGSTGMRVSRCDRRRSELRSS